MSVIKIAPSLLSANHAYLAAEIAAIEAAGADWLHIDVMDGHFVPNLTFGPPVISSLRKHSKLLFDVHLMIEKPELSLKNYMDAGADQITVHVEATTHVHRTLHCMRELGAKVGISLNPGTPVSQLQPILHLVDSVLVMSVNPGFGGQQFLPETLEKFQTLAHLRRHQKHDFTLVVDGGITTTTIGAAAASGAQVFVAGSAVFGTHDYADAIASLRQVALENFVMG